MQGEVSSCSLTALLSVHAALSSLWAASVYSSLSDCSLSVYMIWRKLTRSFFPFSPPAISRAKPFFFQLFHWIFHNCDRIQLSFYFFVVQLYHKTTHLCKSVKEGLVIFLVLLDFRKTFEQIALYFPVYKKTNSILPLQS